MKHLIEARISRGRNAGEVLVPHKHKDGTYVVSKTRFACDYIRVKDEQSIINALRSGLSLRMSGRDPATSPSLISPDSVTIDGAPIDTIGS